MRSFLRRLFVLLAFPGLAAATVVEYYDAGSDRYFLTASPDEIAIVDGGGAGRTWVRTGYGFETQGPCISATTGPCIAKPVCRFHDTSPLGSGSHFYTADEDECRFVRENYPAWTFEGIAFNAFVPEPMTDACPRGTIPVYRTYNNRATHRYTWDPAARDRMLARGWIVEGVAFCASTGRDEPLRSFALRLDADRVRSGPACADVIEALRSCVGPNNLPAPANKFGPFAAGSRESTAFAARTGLDGGTIYAVRGGTPEEAAADAFVQLADADTFGIHVATPSRVSAGLTNVNPLFQFSRFDPKAGEPDDRLTPWAGQYDTEVEVAISFDLRLKRLAAPAGSAAYGHPTLSLFDRRSGVHFYFIVMTYGTVGSADNVLRDGGQGDVIVSTAFRDSAFGRNFGAAQTMATPASFESPESADSGGRYEYRFGRDEFRRIIAAARTLEPALSTDPADYLFDDYHFNNEIAGDGEIGMTLGSMGLKLLRR